MQALPVLAANRLHRAQAGASRCADCRHRLDDRQAIEQRVSGLAVLGSAYGASIGGSGLCVLHDRLVSPHDHCARFSAAVPIDALAINET